MSSSGIDLRGVDHLRFFVGNARQSAYFYRNAFGFDVVAYEGLETGVKHEAGYVLRQGDITFVLTSSLRANDPDNMRLMFHGDGVKDIALAVDDVFACFEHAVRNGAVGVTPPTSLEDDQGVYQYALIRA
jgi:4-hydroxyphenylpyruvate dioxygenase